MEIREAIRTNGTVRAFTDEPVDDATIASILDDSRFAPSGGNRQPWRVAVVGDSLLRRELALLMQPVWAGCFSMRWLIGRASMISASCGRCRTG